MEHKVDRNDRFNLMLSDIVEIRELYGLSSLFSYGSYIKMCN